MSVSNVSAVSFHLRSSDRSEGSSEVKRRVLRFLRCQKGNRAARFFFFVANFVGSLLVRAEGPAPFSLGNRFASKRI